MKEGTRYGKRIRQVFSKLRQEQPDVAIPEPTDPLSQLLLAMLSTDVAESTARQAFKKLTESMVDWNEVRISSALEVGAVLKEFMSNGDEMAQRLQSVLNAIFHLRHNLNLDFLRDIGRREARQFLDSLQGMDDHSAASVMLWSLGAHALPVDNRLMQALRKSDLIAPNATVAEVQAFLERHIQAPEDKEFCILIQKLTSPRGLPASVTKSAGKKKSGDRMAKGKSVTRREKSTARASSRR